MPDTRGLERGRPPGDERLYFGPALRVAIDRDDGDLDGRDPGRHDQTRVVPMRHDERADHARAHAPRGRVAQLALVVLVRKRDVVGAGEVLTEIVRGAHLQREAISHQPFKRQSVDRPGESLGTRLLAREHRDGAPVFRDRTVVAEYELDLVHRLLCEGMERMSLLPPELAGAQEQPGTHLPADDAVPLIRELGQVAMALDVAADEVPDDAFGSGANREWLFELRHRSPRLRHPCDLGPEAFDVRRLFVEQPARDEQRERPVLVTALFDHEIG